MSAKTRLAVVGTALLAGCYTLQPSRGATPQPGKIIGLDINDAGRVALSGSMGPEIGQIEGRLVSRDSAEYVVGVTTLHLLRGGEQVWHGETVHIKSEHVSSLYERRFSAVRSAALAAAGVGAVALIASRSLLGLGDAGSGDGKTPGDTGISVRRPRP